MYIYLYIYSYIFFSSCFHGQVFFPFFTLAIQVGCSALCQCACSPPVGSCVGWGVGVAAPETWAPPCLWGRCCGSSHLESHDHVAAGSPCTPTLLPCHDLSLACLQDCCCCWSPAPQLCSRAAHVAAGPMLCWRTMEQGPQGEGLWVAVGTLRHSWVYGAPERKNNEEFQV